MRVIARSSAGEAFKRKLDAVVAPVACVNPLGGFLGERETQYILGRQSLAKEMIAAIEQEES